MQGENLTVEALKQFFDKDEYAKLSGIEIEEISTEQVVCKAKIDSRHLNANGFVQGGMLYTIADFCFAVLGNYLHPATVTQGGQIQYIRPANTTTLTATAKETVRAGHTCLCDVTICDDKGEMVCVCHFNGFVKEKKN